MLRRGEGLVFDMNHDGLWWCDEDRDQTETRQ